METSDTVKVKAKDIEVGDTIRLLLMGGTEDVEVTEKRILPKGSIYLRLENIAIGVDDSVSPDEELRKVINE